MKHQNVEERTSDICAFWLGVSDVRDLDLDAVFDDQLGLSKMDIIISLEDEFEIGITDDDADKIKTVRQAIEYIKGL